MSAQLTLIAHADGARRPAYVAPGYAPRVCRPADADELGKLYFVSYDAGVACATVEEAIADIRASFSGAYGELWWEASQVIEFGGDIVSAALTVHRAPWDDTPACPFIIELFTARAHRRIGLARALVDRVLALSASADVPAVALRVLSDNVPAVKLYESLGFAPWAPVDGRG